MDIMGQINSWERTRITEQIISASLQKSTSTFLLTLDCAVVVRSTLEEPCLAYHGHKSQSFCIASAGHALRSTYCDFEELREDKAKIPSPWEYMAGLCSFRNHRESTSLISSHVYLCGGFVGLPGRIRMPSLHESPKCGTAWKPIPS